MSARLRLAAAVALLALPLASRSAPAQLRTESSVDFRGRRVALEPRSYVRVSLGGARIEGRASPVAGDTVLRIAIDRGPTIDVPTARVDTLWTRHRATGAGAGIGAAVGGLTLAALGVMFVDGLCDAGNCGGEALGFGLVSGMVGAAGGAILGAAAGALNATWRRRTP